MNLDNIAKVRSWLDSRSFSKVKIVTLQESAHTAADAAAVIGCDLGQIAKSLVFSSPKTGEPLIVVASGRNRVNREKVGRDIGRVIKIAGPEYVLECTGYPPGAVPPFAHLKSLLTLVDSDLFQYEKVYAAAGDAHALFCISPSDLLSLCSGKVASIA